MIIARRSAVTLFGLPLREPPPVLDPFAIAIHRSLRILAIFLRCTCSVSPLTLCVAALNSLPTFAGIPKVEWPAAAACIAAFCAFETAGILVPLTHDRH